MMIQTRLRYGLYALILGVILFLLYRNIHARITTARVAPAIPAISAYSRSPLYKAVTTNDIAKVRQLLSHGADVENGDGYVTPLELAASAGKREIVRALL